MKWWPSNKPGGVHRLEPGSIKQRRAISQRSTAAQQRRKLDKKP